MIYKFKELPTDMEMEVELMKEGVDYVSISIKDIDDSQWQTINLEKDDVYKLIGALHLLHKEMRNHE